MFDIFLFEIYEGHTHGTLTVSTTANRHLFHIILFHAFKFSLGPQTMPRIPKKVYQKCDIKANPCNCCSVIVAFFSQNHKFVRIKTFASKLRWQGYRI